MTSRFTSFIEETKRAADDFEKFVRDVNTIVPRPKLNTGFRVSLNRPLPPMYEVVKEGKTAVVNKTKRK